MTISSDCLYIYGFTCHTRYVARYTGSMHEFTSSSLTVAPRCLASVFHQVNRDQYRLHRFLYVLTLFDTLPNCISSTPSHHPIYISPSPPRFCFPPYDGGAGAAGAGAPSPPICSPRNFASPNSFSSLFPKNVPANFFAYPLTCSLKGSLFSD